MDSANKYDVVPPMVEIEATQKNKNSLNDFNPIKSDIAMMDTNGANNPVSPNKVFTKFFI